MSNIIFKKQFKLISLIAGPVAGLLLFYSLPVEYLNAQNELVILGQPARATAAVGLWMAVWWMTEAIAVYATALLPLAVFPLVGAATIRQTAVSYGHELIYLFLGGFILALAIERWGLHKRLAFTVLSMVGTRPTRIIAAFMGIAAFTSMWVTNTATTIMLLPVAISVIGLMNNDASDTNEEIHSAGSSAFALSLLLGIAYAASIGGIGTIIGTAPNIFIVSFLQTQLEVEISFIRWMMVGVPLVIIFVPLVWWVLARYVYPVSNRSTGKADEMLATLSSGLGTMSRGEKRTLVIFLFTAFSWVCRPLLNEFSVMGRQPLAGLTDSGIAIIAALSLFVTPVKISGNEFLMDWRTAVRLPWGLLILFGGGLSLAAALDATGFSEFIGSRAMGLSDWPQWLIVMTVTGMMIFLTELTSNTATTATLVPILFAVAIGLGMDPYLLVIPAGIAASCAFMLPVATPPNAIVFGTGKVSIPQMSRPGLYLNVLGIVLITGLTYAVVIPVLGIVG